ncbi:hypothetical protein NIES4106_61300 (plasmid) [Fischerella sp. NIES-4106]|nr:hypothetical protein NIES4106_61300 [Fischerella sp. NIES-4106]
MLDLSSLSIRGTYAISKEIGLFSYSHRADKQYVFKRKAGGRAKTVRLGEKAVRQRVWEEVKKLDLSTLEARQE